MRKPPAGDVATMRSSSGGCCPLRWSAMKLQWAVMEQSSGCGESAISRRRQKMSPSPFFCPAYSTTCLRICKVRDHTFQSHFRCTWWLGTNPRGDKAIHQQLWGWRATQMRYPPHPWLGIHVTRPMFKVAPALETCYTRQWT